MSDKKNVKDLFQNKIGTIPEKFVGQNVMMIDI